MGLIEVLIALLVLSFGFLAAGTMQLQALRDGQDSYHRSQARLLLDDMMDRMRNNPDGVDAGAYDDKDTSTTSAADCGGSVCSPTELAARDLAEWRVRLAPSGSASPALPPSPDGTAERKPKGTISAPTDGVYELELSWWVSENGQMKERSAVARFVP